MQTKFKAGDIVRVASGYSPMAIQGNAMRSTLYGAEPIPDKYECMWYDGNQYQRATFHEDIIIAYKLK